MLLCPDFVGNLSALSLPTFENSEYFSLRTHPTLNLTTTTSCSVDNRSFNMSSVLDHFSCFTLHHVTAANHCSDDICSLTWQPCQLWTSALISDPTYLYTVHGETVDGWDFTAGSSNPKLWIISRDKYCRLLGLESTVLLKTGLFVDVRDSKQDEWSLWICS